MFGVGVSGWGWVGFQSPWNDGGRGVLGGEAACVGAVCFAVGGGAEEGGR